MIPEIGVSESALLTDIAMCVNYYRLFSPGLYCCVHAPLQLDDVTRLRPGIIVMVNHGELKQCDPGPTTTASTGRRISCSKSFRETTCSITRTDGRRLNGLGCWNTSPSKTRTPFRGFGIDEWTVQARQIPHTAMNETFSSLAPTPTAWERMRAIR